MARGRPEVLDVIVAEHRHGFVAGQVGAIDRVAARRALQQEHVRGGGAEGLGEGRRRAAPESLDARERHRVLGVVEQRDREAHAHASPGRVDRERRLGRDGHLAGVDLGERLRRGHDQPGSGCRSRCLWIHLHRRHARALCDARRRARESDDREHRDDDPERDEERASSPLAGTTGARRSVSTHTGPRARRSARPKTHRSRAGRRRSNSRSP